jgi:preprotein translocase subunit SecE
MADRIRLLLAVLVLGAAIVGFYWFEDQSTLLRVIGLLVAVGVAIAIAMTSAPGRAAWAFIGDSRNEARRVVWPTRKETGQTTLIVLIVVLLVGILLWLMDLILIWAVRLVTGG